MASEPAPWRPQVYQNRLRIQAYKNTRMNVFKSSPERTCVIFHTTYHWESEMSFFYFQIKANLVPTSAPFSLCAFTVLSILFTITTLFTAAGALRMALNQGLNSFLEWQRSLSPV